MGIYFSSLKFPWKCYAYEAEAGRKIALGSNLCRYQESPSWLEKLDLEQTIPNELFQAVLKQLIKQKPGCFVSHVAIETLPHEKKSSLFGAIKVKVEISIVVCSMSTNPMFTKSHLIVS